MILSFKFFYRVKLSWGNDFCFLGYFICPLLLDLFIIFLFPVVSLPGKMISPVVLSASAETPQCDEGDSSHWSFPIAYPRPAYLLFQAMLPQIVGYL